DGDAVERQQRDRAGAAGRAKAHGLSGGQWREFEPDGRDAACAGQGKPVRQQSDRTGAGKQRAGGVDRDAAAAEEDVAVRGVHLSGDGERAAVRQEKLPPLTVNAPSVGMLLAKPASVTSPVTPDALCRREDARMVPPAAWVMPPPVADRSIVVPDSTSPAASVMPPVPAARVTPPDVAAMLPVTPIKPEALRSIAEPVTGPLTERSPLSAMRMLPV